MNYFIYSRKYGYQVLAKLFDSNFRLSGLERSFKAVLSERNDGQRYTLFDADVKPIMSANSVPFPQIETSNQ